MKNDLSSKSKYFMRFTGRRFTSRLFFSRLYSIIACFTSRPVGFANFKSVFDKSSLVQSSPDFPIFDDDVISLPVSLSTSAQKEFRFSIAVGGDFVELVLEAI